MQQKYVEKAVHLMADREQGGRKRLKTKISFKLLL
jgi:hypothetical protein